MNKFTPEWIEAARQDAEVYAGTDIVKNIVFEAIDEIQRLQSRVAELEAEQRWIPVREWKQDKDGLYVYEENNGLVEVEFFKIANQKYYSQHVKRVFCMTLPQPPKEE